MIRDRSDWAFSEIGSIIDFVESTSDLKLGIARRFNAAGEWELAIDEVCAAIISNEFDVPFQFMKKILALIAYFKMINESQIDEIVRLTLHP